MRGVAQGIAGGLSYGWRAVLRLRCAGDGTLPPAAAACLRLPRVRRSVLQQMRVRDPQESEDAELLLRPLASLYINNR